MFQIFPLFIFLIKQLSLLIPNCELLTNRKNVEDMMLFKNNAAFERNYSNAGENMRRYLSLYDTFTQRKIFSCDQDVSHNPFIKNFLFSWSWLHPGEFKNCDHFKILLNIVYDKHSEFYILKKKWLSYLTFENFWSFLYLCFI